MPMVSKIAYSRRLNPYSNGIYSISIRAMNLLMKNLSIESLNPYSNGIYSISGISHESAYKIMS